MKSTSRSFLPNTHKLLLLALVSFLWLSGCFGGKSQDRVYFAVDYPLTHQQRYTKAKYPKTVLVQDFSTILAYDRQEIVYRSNPYEFKYYWYQLWASKPRKMLRELLAKHLRYTGIFERVHLLIEDKVPDYILDVEISAIEELDATKTEWYAHLGLNLTLTRFDDGTLVCRHEIDARKPVASNQPVYVVKAISEIMDSELTKAFDVMDGAIAAHIAKRRGEAIASQSEAEADLPKEAERETSNTLDFESDGEAKNAVDTPPTERSKSKATLRPRK